MLIGNRMFCHIPENQQKSIDAVKINAQNGVFGSLSGKASVNWIFHDLSIQMVLNHGCKWVLQMIQVKYIIAVLAFWQVLYLLHVFFYCH